MFAWLALTFVWIAADSRTPRHIEQPGLRGKNRRDLEILADLRPIARVILPFVAAIALVSTVRWISDEARRGGRSSRAKRSYTVSTAALFVTILVNPVAAFLGYVGAHAFEHFMVVILTLGGMHVFYDGFIWKRPAPERGGMLTVQTA